MKNQKERIPDTVISAQDVKRATEFPLRAKRTADGQAYTQGVKRATGSVSAFYKYMKENP